MRPAMELGTPAPCCTGEEWRVAPGYPDYAISSCGRVARSSPRASWGPPGCLLRPVSVHAYLQVSPMQAGRPRPVAIHRLVALAFLGDPEPGQEVAHNDGSGTNNHLPNLRWATSKENHADRRVHGTAPLGRLNGRAKLTDAAVRDIRRRYAEGGIRQLDLAEEFGVSRNVVSAVIRRKRWAHVA